MNVEMVKKVLEAFEQEHVHYVVFGGVAINLLGLARARSGRRTGGTPRP